MKNRYLITLVEEAIIDPIFDDSWRGGRMEVLSSEDDFDPFKKDEYRFFTNDPSFLKFREDNMFKEVDEKVKNVLIKVIKSYHRIVAYIEEPEVGEFMKVLNEDTDGSFLPGGRGLFLIDRNKEEEFKSIPRMVVAQYIGGFKKPERQSLFGEFLGVQVFS